MGLRVHNQESRSLARVDGRAPARGRRLLMDVQGQLENYSHIGETIFYSLGMGYMATAGFGFSLRLRVGGSDE